MGFKKTPLYPSHSSSQSRLALLQGETFESAKAAQRSPRGSSTIGLPPTPLEDQLDAGEVLKSLHPKTVVGCSSPIAAQTNLPLLPLPPPPFLPTVLEAGLGAALGLTGIYELTRISPPIHLPLPAFYGCADRDTAIGLSKFSLFVGCK